MNDQEKEVKNCQTIDNKLVLTAFSRNENLKYNEYILQQLPTQKEKQPFLRKRQGLARFETPSKPKKSTITTNIKAIASNKIESQNDFQSKQRDLDEFEKLEQYAEEHPSMISTASYVETVVLKEINNDFSSDQDYSRLIREKAKELEKQIELFEKENNKLQSLTQERNLAIKKLKQDRDEFEKDRMKQIDEFEQIKNEEMRKFRQEKRLFEQHQKQLREHPDKREREEIELLKKQITTLQDDFKQREVRWSTTINRLKERIETLEYENAEIKQEKDLIERKRLDLVHQLQINNTKPQVQTQPPPARRSITEVKSNLSSTNKAQSLPKTTVIRNSEPPLSKTKPATTNGRRTPTSSTIGVNGIKNNIDATRKINSLPTPKLPDEEQQQQQLISPSSLHNSDYPETFDDLDYKSLLTTKHESPRVNIPIAKSSLTFKENIPTIESTTHEIRHDDGRIERIKPDQSKQIIFPNGSKQEISADGKHIRVQFYNGDFKEKHPDGRCVYKYVTTNTTEVEYPDGTRVCEFPNGQVEKHLPDGRQEHILPDKTKNIYLTDGTIISIKPNGEKFIQHPNQTKEIHTDTFKRKLFPNGSILTVFNTGQQEIRYANGKIKVKDAQGNIILEKKEAMK